MNENTAGDSAHVAFLLRERLRAACAPFFAVLLMIAVGHVAAWAMAERYLRPACAAVAAERHWQSLGYRLPGPGRMHAGRRSYCVLQDGYGSKHIISANRLVAFGFVFDPMLVSVLVALPALFHLWGKRRSG